MRHLLLIFLLITGCTTTSEVVISDEVNLPPPTIQKMSMKDVEFKVINGGICLSGEEYEDLSHNMAEIKRFISEQKAVIEFYKEDE